MLCSATRASRLSKLDRIKSSNNAASISSYKIDGKVNIVIFQGDLSDRTNNSSKVHPRKQTHEIKIAQASGGVNHRGNEV